MNITLRIFSIIISLFVFAIVSYKLVKRQLNETNSILWIVIGVLILIAGCFPNLLSWFSEIIGIDYPPSLLFLISTLVLMLITFQHSIHISKNDSKMIELAITVSMLKEENQRLNQLYEEKEAEGVKYRENLAGDKKI